MLKRTKKVTFRLTEAEHKYLKNQVEMSKLNTEQYIRPVLAGEHIAPHSPEMRSFIFCTLRQIGINIKVIARTAKSEKVIRQKEIDEIRQMQADIWNKVVHP